MNFLHAIILSIIEGLTEFLPISSTGHLILASHILRIPESEFLKSFEVIIQLGAICAVIILYLNRIIHSKYLWKPILFAFLPTGILGLTLYKMIKQYLLGNSMIVVIALIFGGLALILFEKFIPKKEGCSNEKLTVKNAFLIGIFQSLSMIPGISRAASTIMGGMFVGLSRSSAVEFSFLLSIPTMIAATLLDLMRNGFSFSMNEYQLLVVGFIGSFITAWFAVKKFLQYIQKHSLVTFGVYRIFVAIAYILFIGI